MGHLTINITMGFSDRANYLQTWRLIALMGLSGCMKGEPAQKPASGAKMPPTYEVLIEQKEEESADEPAPGERGPVASKAPPSRDTSGQTRRVAGALAEADLATDVPLPGLGSIRSG